MLAQSRLNHLRAGLVAGLLILPLAVASAVEPEQTGQTVSRPQRSNSARSAIVHGRVTDATGAPLADVRVRVAIPATDMRLVDVSTPHKRLETRTDARGEYRLEIPEIEAPTTVSLDAMKPGYRRLVGTLSARGDWKNVQVGPGAEAEATLILKPALYFAGVVVDERGSPIPSVKTTSRRVADRGYAFVEVTATDADGSFEIFGYQAQRPGQNPQSKGAVSFVHPDYIDAEIEDIYALAPEKREAIRIVLGTGYKLTGTVLDVVGKPVPKAMIKAIRKDKTHRKTTLTDANGKFALRGVSGGLIMLTARALDIRQQTHLPMALRSDMNNLEVGLKAIKLPANLKLYTVLGMQLADVTSELRSIYDVVDGFGGALIVDPGKDSDRLNIGGLAEGDLFFSVGSTRRIGSVSEFVNQILAETAGQNGDEYSVRVVYNFSTVDSDTARTTRLMKFTKDDRKQLQILSEQLAPEEP
jgi:5-hydroxyisourate hydrolase-like protein (transthyretin family)